MRKFIFVSLFFVTGCAVRSVYVPASENIILFNAKRQIQTDAYVGSNHAELQAAINPVNHLAVGLNVNYGTGLSINEGCIGWYGYTNNNAKWRYEMLVGGGYNKNFQQQDNSWFYAVKHVNDDFETISNYSKYYVQPSLGYFSTINMYKISYSFSVACKASYLYFNNYIYREIDGDQSVIQNKVVYILNKEYYDKTLYLLEPCISNKVGIRNWYVVIQGQFMIPYSKEIDVSYTKFSPVAIMSLGLQYNFVFKKQKVKKDEN